MTGAQANSDNAWAWAHTISPHILAAMDSGALTYREIADHLNAHGVLTRSSGMWHPSTVQRTMRYLGHPPGAVLSGWTYPSIALTAPAPQPQPAPVSTPEPEPPAPPARQGSIIDPRMRRLRT